MGRPDRRHQQQDAEKQLDAVLQLVEERAAGGEWWVTSDELAEFFEEVVYYRAAYAEGVAGVDRFGAADIGELATLLTRLCGEEATRYLRRSGLYLTHDDRVDLTERLVHTMRAAIVLHTPDPKQFRSMLHYFRRYDRALATYFVTYLNSDRLCDRCADEYVNARSHREGRTYRQLNLLRETVAAYLRQLVARKLVHLETLAPALLAILVMLARDEGCLPPEPEPAGYSDSARGGADTDHRRGGLSPRDARRILGVNPSAGSREIRLRYRELIREYHPDINPEGLEMAKRVNAAYGILVESDPV
jgi:hypothetical protein